MCSSSEVSLSLNCLVGLFGLLDFLLPFVYCLGYVWSSSWHRCNQWKASLKSKVEAIVSHLRSRTWACGVYYLHEWSLISPGCTGSVSISGLILSAAAAGPVGLGVSLFDGVVGRNQGLGSVFVR